MIPEYYMYEAERCDNGETVRGYYAFKELNSKEEHFIIRETVGTAFTATYFTNYEVKPETLRRVAVKPKQTDLYGYENKRICPNCEFIVFNDFDYCVTCGQRLDWRN